MRLELTRANAHYPLKVARLPIPPPGLSNISRAKNGTRTRDPDLGKVVLYQLSYFRVRRFRQPLLTFQYPIRAKNGTRTRDPDLGKVVLYQLSYFRVRRFRPLLLTFQYPIRAKNGTRTRDPDLGKVVLYQLSYFRVRIADLPLLRMQR